MKKFIALASAFAMMLPIAVVNAKTTPIESGITVVYDAAKSTPTEAVVEVYFKGVKALGGDTIDELSLNFDFNTAYVDVSTAKSEAAARITEHDSVNAETFNTNMTNTNSRKQLYIGLTGSEGVSWDESKPIITARIPLLGTAADITAATDFLTHNRAANRYSIKVDGVSKNDSFNAEIDKLLPQSAKVTGTVVDEIPDSDPATYFKIVGAPLAGTAYWYADFNGTAKKLAANVPNTQGTADLGFVYTGADAPSSVKIVCE